jgi:glutamate 5-kinase
VNPTAPASSSPDRDPTRPERLAHVKSVVVKLGTQLLTDKQQRLDTAYVAEVARQVMSLRDRGVAVTIVSSGAIGAGVRELNLPKRPTDLAKLQAVAAVGQRRLMDVWGEAFAPFGVKVAQILLTREDIDVRARFLNLRNTIHAIHELGAVPVINENDTISTDEIVRISFGDNDILAGTVAQALRADLLVLLTVVDGVLDEHGKRIPTIEAPEDAKTLVRTDKSALGKGGMGSKLTAASLVTRAGEAMVVGHGRTENVLPRILAGEEIGTLFIPARKRRTGRHRWLGSARAAGAVVVDDGAVSALVEKGRSLLAAGVTKVEGTFGRGDVIDVRTPAGAAIARGLTNYTSADLELIRGKKAAEVKSILKEKAHDEVVHRDNLVVL